MFLWPVIALVGILSAVWFFGTRGRTSVGDAAAVRQRLSEDHPEFEPADIALDPDGTHALASAAAGTEVILVFPIGNQVATRVLDTGGVRGIDVTDGAEGRKRVVVSLYDLGCPRLAFTLSTADASQWTARLDRLVRPVPDGSPGSAARVTLPG